MENLILDSYLTSEQKENIKKYLLKKGNVFFAGEWEYIQKRDFMTTHRYYEKVLSNGAKWELIFYNTATYVNAKKSRLRDSDKTKYNVRIELTYFKPDGQPDYPSINLKEKNITGEGKTSNEKIEKQIKAIEEFAERVFGITEVSWSR